MARHATAHAVCRVARARRAGVEIADPRGDTSGVAVKDDEHRAGLADAAGRAALFPARAAARAWRGSIEDLADEVLSSPEIARVVDRALSGPLPEEVARSV